MINSRCSCRDRIWLVKLLNSSIVYRKILKFKQKTLSRSQIADMVLGDSYNNPLVREFLKSMIEKKILIQTGFYWKAHNKIFTYSVDDNKGYEFLSEDEHYKMLIEVENKFNPPTLPI